jgi:hypothetical protein
LCIRSPSIAILGYAAVTQCVPAIASRLFVVLFIVRTGVIIEFEGFAFCRFLTFEEVRNILTAFQKDLDQCFRNRLVFIIVERGG